jgi:hypothetical protein
VNLDIKRVVANRHWCNKLWNAIRFALLNLGPDFQPTPDFARDSSQLPMACRWILSKATAAVEATNQSFKDYHFGEAVQVPPPFFLTDAARGFPAVGIPLLHHGCGCRRLTGVVASTPLQGSLSLLLSISYTQDGNSDPLTCPELFLGFKSAVPAALLRQVWDKVQVAACLQPCLSSPQHG